MRNILNMIVDAIEDDITAEDVTEHLRYELGDRYTEEVIDDLLRGRKAIVYRGQVYIKTSDGQWCKALHLDDKDRIVCDNADSYKFIGSSGLTYDEWRDMVLSYIVDGDLGN